MCAQSAVAVKDPSFVSLRLLTARLVSSLQLEVSQLEGSLQQPKAQSSMSPYLVPDAAALCQHLNLIRQLAGSGCFIIIIPRTGQCTATSSSVCPAQ